VTETSASGEHVYRFSEGNKTMRELLGGKGANLAEMTTIGLPVPPGFTITTEVCNHYSARRYPSPATPEPRLRWAKGQFPPRELVGPTRHQRLGGRASDGPPRRPACAIGTSVPRASKTCPS